MQRNIVLILMNSKNETYYTSIPENLVEEHQKFVNEMDNKVYVAVQRIEFEGLLVAILYREE